MPVIPMTQFAPTGQAQEAMYGAIINRLVNRGQMTQAYYILPDGSIGVGPANWLMEASLERRKRGARWTRLMQAGPDSDPYPPFDLYDYSLARPFENLAIWGGLRHIPRKQIIEMGLHHLDILVPSCGTPLAPFHFQHTDACFNGARPYDFSEQLKAEDLLPIDPCVYCGYEAPSDAARQTHIKVMHKDEYTQERLAANLGLIVNRQGGVGMAVDLSGNIGLRADRADRATPAGSPAMPFACAYCGTGHMQIQELLKCTQDCSEGDIGAGTASEPELDLPNALG